MSNNNIDFTQAGNGAANVLGNLGSLSGKGCGLLGCGGLILLILIIGGWMVSIYNGMVKEQQKVETAWANVENVYQRRADLIPNLVKIVKNAKEGEIEVLERTMEARSKATSIKIDPTNMTPEDLQKFQAAQGELGNALSRLMAVSEAYPEVKSNQNYRDFQVQLEGSENRITVERKNFNEAARSYNETIKKFPNVIFAGMFGFREKPYFKAQDGADKAPELPDKF